MRARSQYSRPPICDSLRKALEPRFDFLLRLRRNHDARWREVEPPGSIFEQPALSPTSSPDLACVVLALGNPPELREAVASLLAQGGAGSLEIVVVNSGGGGAARSLAEAGLPVTVIEREERLFAGAARNLGIRATKATYVAFLAADCRAEPGWVEARLRAHRPSGGGGAEAVASAVTNAYRRSPAAWASYVALFHRRMPGAPAETALLYGVSYARSLLERHGPFREDLRSAEDTEFHQRFAGEVEIAWVPEVRTAHRHPRGLAALLRDQVRRGARSARAWRVLGRHGGREVAADALRRVPASARGAWRAAEPGDRAWIALAIALLPVAALAYAWGALRAGKGASGGEEGPEATLARAPAPPAAGGGD